DEILTEIVIPHPENLKIGYCEVRQKQAFDWPLTLAAVALRISGSHVDNAHVVMGHVAPVPWISVEAEDVLRGSLVTQRIAESAGEAAVTGAKPLSRNSYKLQLARVAVKRAVLRAIGARLVRLILPASTPIILISPPAFAGKGNFSPPNLIVACKPLLIACSGVSIRRPALGRTAKWRSQASAIHTAALATAL